MVDGPLTGNAFTRMAGGVLQRVQDQPLYQMLADEIDMATAPPYDPSQDQSLPANPILGDVPVLPGPPPAPQPMGMTDAARAAARFNAQLYPAAVSGITDPRGMRMALKGATPDTTPYEAQRLYQGVQEDRLRQGLGANATLSGLGYLAEDFIRGGTGASDATIAQQKEVNASLFAPPIPAPRPSPADIAQQQEDTLKRATGNEEAYASIMDRVAAGPDAGPLVYRANNPGGINAAKWVQNMPGYIGSYEGTPGNATAVFETPSRGFNALAHRVAQNAGDGLSSYIASYGGGGQDYLTSGYFDNFLSASGLSPDATIDIGDDDQLFAILKGHTVAEGGADRFSDEDIIAGIAMFREEQAAEPAGDNDANAIVAATANNPPVMQLDYSTAKSASDIMDDLGLSKTPINAAEAFRRIQNTDYAGDFDTKEAALDSLFNAGIAMMRAASRPGASTLESLSYGLEALGAGIEGRRQQTEAAGEARRNQDVELLKMQIADEQAAFDRRLAVVKQLNDAAAEARQATMDNATLQKTLAQTDAIRQGMVGSGGFGPSLQDRRLVLDSAAKYASERAPAPPVGLLETEEEAEARQQAWEFYYNEFLQRLGMDPANTLFFGDSVL
jgi:hypothetical protein